MHLVGVKVDQISPGPNISSWNKFPSLNLALSEVFMLPSKSRFLLCHTCDDASRRPAPSPSPFDLHQPPPPVFDSPPSLPVPALGSPPIRCESGYSSHSTAPSSPSQRGRVGGSARRSWHQPVIPPFLLPPSVSLLNQIISLTHAQATPFLHQLLRPSFCSSIPSSLNPC